MANIGKELDLAEQYLREGDIVAIPTETVYGLAANALSPDAVLKIFEAKNRPTFNPLIVHTYDFGQVHYFVRHIPPVAEKLANSFWPGPLTLLLPKKDIIPDLVTAGSPRVAIRIPNHPLTLSLLERLDFPLAAPSANPFGYISPTTPAHVASQLKDKVPYILDGGEATIGLESTIIGFDENDQPVIHRLGGISLEAVEAIAGTCIFQTSSEKPETSGMLKSHYAPGIPLLLGNIEEMLPQYSPGRTGILSFARKYPGIPPRHQVILSSKGDLFEAARNLFSALHYLDSLDLEVILAENVPNEGLGRAINDRLERARVENKQ